MLSALLVMAGLAVVLGAVLGFAATKFKVEENPLVEKIDAILPQTQCGQCGFPGCKPYATAIAAGEADINQCPPGGEPKPKSLAVIDEEVCIGCTLCIQACPVDAILGAAKQMHTVIAAECTGCELCVPPCPVDCISMAPIGEEIANWKWRYPVFAIKAAG
jgi:electron transport complex protein RnfB